MDFEFDEAQAAVADLSRKIFREHVTPRTLAAVESAPEHVDHALWQTLASAGLLGTAIGERAGGSGQGLLELCALLEEAGAAVAPVPLWATLVLGALPIAQVGSPEQQRRFLPGVAAGEIFLTAAWTESGLDDGEHGEHLTTMARPAGDAWALDGVKVLVPAAHLARRVLVPARTGSDAQRGVFLLDPRAPGVTLERQILTTGEPHFRITMRDARVAAEDVLGDPARGAEILDWLAPRAAVALCAMELGVATRVLRMTAAYTTERQQFDRPLATFQAVSQRAADAYIDVEAMRVATWQAAFRLASGRPSARAVASAKLWASEAGHRVVYAAQHLHGGMGFDLEYPLHRYYLLSKQIELTLGSASIHLARLGADLARS